MGKFEIPKISFKEINNDPDIISLHNRIKESDKSEILEIIEDSTRSSQLIKIEDINLEIDNIRKEIKTMTLSLEGFKIDVNFIDKEIEEEGPTTELLNQKKSLSLNIDNLRHHINLKERKILNLEKLIDENLITSN
jgi:hypothetical protein